MKKKSSLDEFFITEAALRRKSRCGTCNHKNVEKFNAAFRAFDKKRKESTTCISWEVYINKYASTAKSGLSYPYKYKAALRHAENCLGLKKD